MQIKINNKVLDINTEECSIDLIKKYEDSPGMTDMGALSRIEDNHIAKYFISIKSGNRILKSFQITQGREEFLKDFVYNFDYEISDFKKEKYETLKNMQDTLENLYKNKK